MLTLAAMTWAAYMFSRAELHMLHSVPPPVVVERSAVYDYNKIESAIYVPSNWKADCYSEQLVVLEMLNHFNAYRNGNNKLSEVKLDQIASKWVCIE